MVWTDRYLFVRRNIAHYAKLKSLVFCFYIYSDEAVKLFFRAYNNILVLGYPKCAESIIMENNNGGLK